MQQMTAQNTGSVQPRDTIRLPNDDDDDGAFDIMRLHLKSVLYIY